jgi:hypothetical protein
VRKTGRSVGGRREQQRGERDPDGAAQQLGGDEGEHRGRGDPAKVSLSILPTVIAGLAKLVELVKKYAAPMYAATAGAASAA